MRTKNIIFFGASIVFVFLFSFAIYCIKQPARACSESENPETLQTIKWNKILKQDAAWYGTKEALRIAANVLLYQRKSGGWSEDTDMAAILGSADKKRLQKEKDLNDSTIDNNATTTQLIFLAMVYNKTHKSDYMYAFNKGLDYLFRAQYENGGWPQFYPDTSGYLGHVTFNDNAMINVLNLMKDISDRKAIYAFVSEIRNRKASLAVKKGIRCILGCQVKVNGKLTVWCAQYDSKTLMPAKARSFELPSLSSFESIGIVKFLMSIKNPAPEIITAIQSAVEWFGRSEINGIRIYIKRDASLPEGKDVIVESDPSASPVWARFYEIDTNRPFFCGRDGIKKYNLSEIEYERRIGYTWYITDLAGLLDEDYPEWQLKWVPDNSL